MKKILVGILSCLLLMLGLSACGSNPAATTTDKLQVMTTIYPVYDFTAKVAGEAAEVKCLLPAGSDDHFWEPSSEDVLDINKSQLLIYCGDFMESWMESILASLDNSQLQVATAGEGVVMQIGQGETGATEVDPHIWLDTDNAIAMVKNIQEALQKVDPNNAQTYQANAERVILELQALDSEYQAALLEAPKKEFVVSHAAFGYLANRYGLTQVAIRGLHNEADPTPARIAEVNSLIKEHGLQYIFEETAETDKISQTLAQDTGAKILILSPLGSLTQEQLDNGEDYFSIMRANLANLKIALEVESQNE